MIRAVTRSILEFLPGYRVFKEKSLCSIFAIFFYLCLIVVSTRFERLRELTAGGPRGDMLSAVSTMGALAILYVGAVFCPSLVARRNGSGSRLASRFSANWLAVAGLCLILAAVLAAILGPFLAPYDPVGGSGDFLERYAAPSAAHLMGTDKFGRDVFSRVIYGARASLTIGFAAVAVATLIGILLGGVAGYAGGWLDEIVMRAADGLLAFPRLLIVILLVAFFSNAYGLLIVAIGCTSWMGIARVIRAEILKLKETEFFQAAVATGAGRSRILWKHLLPNAVAPVIVAATLQVGGVILLESTLSFLGLGVQPPAPSWGNMVLEGREALLGAWWVSAFPGLAIAISVVAFNLLGDGLRDALEVKRTA